jgi:hypothetical protein
MFRFFGRARTNWTLHPLLAQLMSILLFEGTICFIPVMQSTLENHLGSSQVIL